MKIGILSDIHGNPPALRAVLADIRNQKPTKLFVLGDIINGIDPHTCIQVLRAWIKDTCIETTCIRGNAESYLLTPDRDSMPIQNEAWHLDILQLIQWFEDQLSEDDLAWLRSFPMTARWEGAYFVHDSPLDRIAVQETNAHLAPKYREWYFHGQGISPEMAEEKWLKTLAFMEVEQIVQIFCGHTHIAFCKDFGSKTICNVGSVGMPLDSDPRPAWALLTVNSDGDGKVEIRRVAYEIADMLHLIDQTPDYPNFKKPGYREAYKKWMLTGVLWKVHLRENQE
jgi:predicted phosphodiesterase